MKVVCKTGWLGEGWYYISIVNTGNVKMSMRTLNSWLTIGIQCWMGILSAKLTIFLIIYARTSGYQNFRRLVRWYQQNCKNTFLNLKDLLLLNYWANFMICIHWFELVSQVSDAAHRPLVIMYFQSHYACFVDVGEEFYIFAVIIGPFRISFISPYILNNLR